MNIESWLSTDLGRKIWENNVESYCYASGSKVKGNEYDLVIMDEAHRITELSYEFFKDNKIKLGKVIA